MSGIAVQLAYVLVVHIDDPDRATLLPLVYSIVVAPAMILVARSLEFTVGMPPSPRNACSRYLADEKHLRSSPSSPP